MITTVFFDIDDTVFDFKRSEKVALSETLRELGIEPTQEMTDLYSKINRGQWEALERGETTRDVLLLKRYELLFLALGISGIEPCRAQAIYEQKLSRTYYYIDGAEDLLSTLQGKYRIYFASNGTAIVQDGRIAISGIDKFADGIFISERIGYDKPSREFFDACFSKIPNFKREEAIIIGDSLTSDILGGIRAGIKTCLYNPKKKQCRDDIRPDYEIHDLNEIPSLLENI